MPQQLLVGADNKLLLTVSAIGQDRPGIIFKLAHIISENAGNIVLQRSMKVGVDFAIIIVVAFERTNDVGRANTVSSLNAGILGEELGILTRVGKQTDSKSQSQIGTKYVITTGGDDSVGLVEVITSVLFRYGLNIDAMDSQVSYRPVQGTKMFESEFEITVPPNVNMEQFENDMDKLAEDTYQTITIKAK